MNYITQHPIPSDVIFFSSSDKIEVLRLSRDGVWANPEVPVDEVARAVLNAIDANIKILVQRAIKDEREACLQAVEKAKIHQFILYPKGAAIDANKVGNIYAHQHKECVNAIKARSKK